MQELWLGLRIPKIEKLFTQVSIDLHEILVLDGIDLLPSPSRIRIRSHDRYGPLSDILIEETGDRYPVLDEIEREAAKLIAIVRVRKRLAGKYPECQFLLPTRMDGGWLTGIRVGGRTVLAEGPTHWEAYHALARKSVVIP